MDTSKHSKTDQAKVNDPRELSHTIRFTEEKTPPLGTVSMDTQKVLVLSALISGGSVSDAVDGIRSRCPYS
jgi:hypothetical protein